MQLQKEIEDKYSRKGIRARVLQDIDTESLVFLKCITTINQLFAGQYFQSKMDRLAKCTTTTYDIAIELFASILVVKGMSPIQALATQIGNRIGYEDLLEGVKTAAEIIAVCEVSGLYDIYHSSNPDNETGTLAIRPNFTLSDDVLDFVEQTKYLPPMLCKPRDWTDNSTGGYLNGSGSVILGRLNHHNLYQNLNAINIIQAIEWELDLDMLVDNTEVPNKLLDTDDKVKQFDNFAEQSKVVYQELIAQGNAFYFVWKNDKRGRMNCQGYHLNLQSTQFKKSILNFKHKELVV